MLRKCSIRAKKSGSALVAVGVALGTLLATFPGLRLDFAPAPVAAQAADPTLDAEVQQFIRTVPNLGITPLGQDELVLLAVNGADGGPSLIAYVGNLREQPLQLPPGEWWLYALRGGAPVQQSIEPLSLASPASLSSLNLSLSDVPGDNAASSAALATMVHFALASHVATLASLSLLMDSPGDDTSSSVDALADALASAVHIERDDEQNFYECLQCGYTQMLAI